MDEEEKEQLLSPNRDAGGESQLELFEELVAVEKSRIESANRRTEVARLAIETNDRSDERQFTFHMKRLDNEAADSERRYQFASRFLLSVGAAMVVLIGFLVYMAFFGDERQADIATQILWLFFAGLGGYGIVTALTSVAKRFLFRGARKE